MKNSGKTISQIISKSFVGKTILKIDDDESLLGRRICKAVITQGPLYIGYGLDITVAAKNGNPEEKLFLPFDQENKLLLRETNMLI